MFLQKLVEAVAQDTKPGLRHPGDQIVPTTSLTQEGQRAGRAGVGFQDAIEPRALSGLSEKGEEALREGREEEEPVAALGDGDGAVRQAHAEAGIFEVAEQLFAGKTLSIALFGEAAAHLRIP